MPQDDSKQWEHLLSQENDPSWSDPAPLNLHSLSRRYRAISAASSTSRGNKGSAERYFHDTPRILSCSGVLYRYRTASVAHRPVTHRRTDHAKHTHFLKPNIVRIEQWRTQARSSASRTRTRMRTIGKSAARASIRYADVAKRPPRAQPPSCKSGSTQ